MSSPPPSSSGLLCAAAPEARAATSASVAAAGAPEEPFRGLAADSRLGELLLDVLPIACSVGNALDLHHARYVCGTTFRLGVRRADGSLDSGFLGGTADMIRSACRLQGLDAMRAERRRAYADRKRTTQLIRAAQDGDEERVRELVAAGALPNLVDSAGWAALHYAAYDGHVRIAQLLLDGKFHGKGANLDAQTGEGWSPLMEACGYSPDADIVRPLLERGADVTLRDDEGETALFYTRRFRRAAVVAALLEARGATEKRGFLRAGRPAATAAATDSRRSSQRAPRLAARAAGPSRRILPRARE